MMAETTNPAAVSCSNGNADRPDATAAASEGSSSTEGPDSPGQSSATSSPIPPAVIVHDEDDDSRCEYSVTFVTDEMTKDGDVVRYRIVVQKGSSPDSWDIERQYADFAFLHHNLTHGGTDGLIVPPLPDKPAVDPQAAESRSKRQLGSGNRNIRGDDFAKDAKALEAYTSAMARHPTFGTSRHLREFLELKEAPARTKIRGKGLFSMGETLKQTLDARKHGSTPDVDEAFQKEKEWSSRYAQQLRDACAAFQNVMDANIRLVSQITHLSTALSASAGGNDGTNAFYNRLNSRFSACLEDEKRGIDSVVGTADKTMGVYFALWSGYMDAELAMLMRRTCLMAERESAVRAFSKAKPGGPKAQQLLQIKEQREKEFDVCSRKAKEEIRRFHQRRLVDMRDALVQYAEGQIASARKAYADLSACAGHIRDFPLPELPSTD